jgi:hypothetical protein
VDRGTNNTPPPTPDTGEIIPIIRVKINRTIDQNISPSSPSL